MNKNHTSDDTYSYKKYGCRPFRSFSIFRANQTLLALFYAYSWQVGNSNCIDCDLTRPGPNPTIYALEKRKLTHRQLFLEELVLFQGSTLTFIWLLHQTRLVSACLAIRLLYQFFCIQIWILFINLTTNLLYNDYWSIAANVVDFVLLFQASTI